MKIRKRNIMKVYIVIKLADRDIVYVIELVHILDYFEKKISTHVNEILDEAI